MPLLLTQHAENHRADQAQDRLAGAFADASELADGLGQRAHRSAADQARQHACAAFRERLRICAAHETLQTFEGAELLLRHDIAELARAVGSRGHVAQHGEERGYGAANRLLGEAAVKAEGGSDFGDRIRREELHCNRDKIGGHGVSPIWRWL